MVREVIESIKDISVNVKGYETDIDITQRDGSCIRLELETVDAKYLADAINEKINPAFVK